MRGGNTRLKLQPSGSIQAKMTGQTNLVKLLLLLVQCSLILRCQSAANDTSSVLLNSTESDTLDRTNTSTSEGVLLSGNEFVDFTEAPMILFDGTSNESNETTSSAKPTSSSSTTTTTTTTTSSPTTTAASTTSTSTPAATSSSVTTTETSIVVDDLVDGDSDGTEEATDDEAQDDNKDPSKEFDPPQNVSQYMDYIERLFHDLRHQITDLFEPHIPQLIRTSQMVQLSASCSYDMLRMALALRQFEPWALRMIDSSGKVPEGIFEGSFTALGSYDQCLGTVFTPTSSSTSSSSGAATTTTTTTTATMTTTTPTTTSNNQVSSQTQGKYCLVNVSPYLPPKPPADRVERMFQEEANRRNYTKDDQFSRLSPMFYYMKFRIGVCIPSTCLDSDVNSISSALSTSLRLNITIPNCRVKQLQPITSHQLAGGLVFGLILALVLGATLMDYSRRRLEFGPGKIVMLKKPALTTANETTKVPVLLRNLDQALDSDKHRNNFDSRLDKNWSWMSFSLLTSYKLYFKNRRSSKCSQEQQHGRQTVSPASGQVGNTNLGTTNSMIIRCLNGIRVLSLCWVIVANSYVTLDPRATKRLTKTREAPKDFLFQVVAQASLAIETFFFLSGVLMSLSFSRKLNQNQVETSEANRKGDNAEVDIKNNHQLNTTKHNHRQAQPSLNALKWIHFYVHRYVRMTPATMLVIAFTMFAFRYGDGPLWFEATHKAHQSCSQNWWRHLLHVANYIDTRQMCFIHYWYIAADMQLFLFAPILLFLIHQRRRIGYAVATLIGLLSMGSIFYTTYMHNLPPTLLFYNSDPESRREFGNTIMTKPLTHALPYMVGMLLGNWLSKQTNNNYPLGEEQATKRTLTTLLGFVASTVALAEVFLPYKWNNSHLPTRFLAALYAALFRFGWSLVLAYIVISCRHRRGRSCRNELDGTRLVNSRSNCHCSAQSRQHKIVVIDETTKKGWIQETCGGKFNYNSPLGSPLGSLVGAIEPEQPVVWCMCGSGGGLLNRLLSWSIFTHLSKLSFTAYLIHLPLMSVFIAQTRGLFAFSHTLVIHLALSYLVMTFILSFLLVHIIELPFITFERYLFDKCFYTKERNFRSSKSFSRNGFQDSGGGGGVGGGLDKISKLAPANRRTPENFPSDGILRNEVIKIDKALKKGGEITTTAAAAANNQASNHLNYVISERL